MKISTDDYTIIKNYNGTFGICMLKIRVDIPPEITIEVGSNEFEFIKAKRKFFDIDYSRVIFKNENSVTAVRYILLYEALSILDCLLGSLGFEYEDIHELGRELDSKEIFIAKNSSLDNGGLVAIFAERYFVLIAPVVYEEGGEDGYAL